MRRHPPIAPILLMVCVISLLPVAASGWQYWCDDPSPTNVMQISRPAISWPIRPEKGTGLTGVQMTLDGTDVPARYSESEAAVTYLPPAPLAQGKHKVQCKVVFDDRHSVTKSWSFEVAKGALAEIPTPDDDQKKAWAAANGYRRLMGLPDFVLDPRYCAAATAHMRYEQLHAGSVHGEIPGQAGFTGKNVSDRLGAFGCSPSGWEDIDYLSDPVACVDRLVPAPYHRRPFTLPGSPTVGVGYSRGVCVLDFGPGSGSAVVVYPVDGQKGVPTMWYDLESPNPLRIHKDLTPPVGYVISYHCHLSSASRINVGEVSLTTDDGHRVPFKLNTPDNDYCLHTDAFIIPEKPLQTNTTYHVAFAVVTDSSINASRAWSFTTGPSSRRTAPQEAAPVLPFAAAASGDLEAIISILKQRPDAVNLADSSGATALHYAAQAGSDTVVAYLISKGARVNAAKKDGVTPLMVAASLGKKEAVRSLLSSGADLSATDNRGRTAISLAKDGHHDDIVRMLMPPTSRAEPYTPDPQ